MFASVGGKPPICSEKKLRAVHPKHLSDWRITASMSVAEIVRGIYQEWAGMVRKAFQTAFKVGYRHFDLSAVYWTEAIFGEVFEASGLPREAIFIESKLGFKFSPTKVDRMVQAKSARIFHNCIREFGVFPDVVFGEDVVTDVTTKLSLTGHERDPVKFKIGPLVSFHRFDVAHRSVHRSQQVVSNVFTFGVWVVPLSVFPVVRESPREISK